MKATLFAVLLAGIAAAPPSKLPSDINSQSFSRLPFITRDQLSGDALRVYDLVVGKDPSGKEIAKPGTGPKATSLYSIGVAEPMDKLNQYIRTSVVGTAMYQI